MKIIPRSEWGARKTALVPADWSNVRLWLHHTVGTNPTASASPEAEQRIMREIQAFHIDGNGWSDIGYSYVCAPSGRVYEGRGFGKRGAHSPEVNDEPSVALMGDYSKTPPTVMQIQSVYELQDHLGATDVLGHRDSYPTACPGDAAYLHIVLGAEKPMPTHDPPFGGSLRLSVSGLGGGVYAGWDECKGPLRWISKNGLKPDTKAAISWRGSTWRGPVAVSNVAKHLVNKYLKES